MADKPDILGGEQFQELCRREFRYLEEEYGFAERPPGKPGTVNSRLSEVRYVSATTFVLIKGLDMGEAAGVYFGRPEPEALENEWFYDSTLLGTSYNLETLLKIRRPDLSLAEAIQAHGDTGPAFQIKHYARSLRECADDVLRGDLSILPTVKEAEERRRKELGRQGFREWLGDLVALWRARFRARLRRGFRRRRRKK